MTGNEYNKESQPQRGADKADSNIHGRVDNCGNKQFEAEERQADISHVDRQEGTMNNGVLGGNFSKEDA